MLSRQNSENDGNRELARLVVVAGVLLLIVLALALLRVNQTIAGGWPAHLSELAASHLPLAIREALAEQARLMSLPLADDTQAYWFLARAGGIIAYILLWLSSCWGILMSSKATKGVVSVPVAYALHQYLPILAVGFAALHALVLLGDSYINFSLWQILVPFTSSYEPLWTGLGTLTFYLLIALVASFYVRQWIGQKTWRALHYASYLAFAIALLHGVMAGSDTDTTAMQALYWITGGTAIFLIYFRLLAYEPRKRRTTAPARPPAADS